MDKVPWVGNGWVQLPWVGNGSGMGIVVKPNAGLWCTCTMPYYNFKSSTKICV